MATAVVTDIAFYLGAPLPRLGQSMNDPKVIELFCTIAATAQDHLLGASRAEPAREKAMRAHAWKKAEIGFRQAEIGAAFGDDDVERQKRFESAAERIALDEPDRDDRPIEAQHVAMQDTHACPAIVDQRGAIAVPDMRRKQVEIPPQRKHPGEARPQHDVADRHIVRDAGVGDVVLPMFEFG